MMGNKDDVYRIDPRSKDLEKSLFSYDRMRFIKSRILRSNVYERIGNWEIRRRSRSRSLSSGRLMISLGNFKGKRKEKNDTTSGRTMLILGKIYEKTMGNLYIL